MRRQKAGFQWLKDVEDKIRAKGGDKKMTWVNGNKTYIVAGLTILYELIGMFIGQMQLGHAVELILAGLGVLGFRSAIKKME